MQLDNLEVKLAESRRQNHDYLCSLQEVTKTAESNNANLVQVKLEQERLQRQPDATSSQLQRSLSYDSETRAKSEFWNWVTMQEKKS